MYKYDKLFNTRKDISLLGRFLVNKSLFLMLLKLELVATVYCKEVN